MATIKIETKNQLNINQKPRVYFTCHPEDFEKYFRKICDDIFATHDCAIYYTENMAEVIAQEDRTTDLGRNNLFVVPVTLKLLNTPNRAMDVDIPYALQQHIPVLPFMMEQGIDAFYSKPDKFGELQYLSPFSSDSTEISYAEKLKKYLQAVLISDELAKRVRAAFDAYIFLSYRKKDRRYANELMRLIHSIPECRDIAIWFDEFLTPGESFREGIDRILHDSKLFALLVTPNLLEEGNFVMTAEYPAAKNSGIPILPTEMVRTDKVVLSEKFPNIPSIVQPDEELFRNQLLDTVTQLATQANNTPEHNYLIGIAYLDGIDVEVNREYALELITSAAEAGLPEAMEKLFRMYHEGIGVALDYRKAVVWAEKCADYRICHDGEEHPDTLVSLNNLAVTYNNLGEYRRSAELQEQVYHLQCKILGETHLDTLIALINLAATYENLGNQPRLLELRERAYALSCQVLGENDPHTIIALSNLAMVYGSFGEYRKALELKQKAYTLSCQVLGEDHPTTLITLNNLASTCSALGEHPRALELKEKAYLLSCQASGERHPGTLTYLNNLASTCNDLGDYHRALELYEKVCPLRCSVLGEEHPDTLISLYSLACVYSMLDDHEKALELGEKVYALQIKILGEDHPIALKFLENLAVIFCNGGNLQKALKLISQAYSSRCKVLGEEHPDTLASLSNLALIYGKLGNHQEEAMLEQRLYLLRCKILGENHPDTLKTLCSLALTYGKMKDYQKEAELEQKLYTLRCKVLGEEHPDTLTALNNLALTCRDLEDYEKALKLLEKLYILRCKVLGENHSKTLRTLNHINGIKKKLNAEA